MDGREALRRVIRETLLEVVDWTPQQKAAIAALNRTAGASGTKAGVLFSRVMSKRIDRAEADQMADEVRRMAASNPKAVQAFDTALEDAWAGVEAPSRIGGMISGALQAGLPAATKHASGVRPEPQAPAQTFTMRSVAKG